MLNYSDIFDKKNLNSFQTWCNDKNLEFLTVGTKRKKLTEDNGKTQRTRSLFVLKENYHGNKDSGTSFRLF